MLEEDLEVAIKVVVVGNGGVGKSSMIQRYCKGLFTKDYKKTIGVDFLEKQIQIQGQETRLMLWDTAGQEEFDAITKAYYRGAHVCVVAYSTVDRESFLAVENWRKKVEVEVGEIVMCIVQNKIDLIDEACITDEEVDALAKTMKLKLFRTSVKENFNVNQVFEYLCSKYFDRKSKERREMKKNQNVAHRGFSDQSEAAKVQETEYAGSSSGSNMAEKSEGQSFQIKPNKERVKNKKKSLCVLL